jgi:hypothetical protein
LLGNEVTLLNIKLVGFDERGDVVVRND